MHKWSCKRMLRCLLGTIVVDCVSHISFRSYRFDCASQMNKLKEKFENAMKSTAMSAQQIYKHKSFNLSKTQEDPE